MSGPEPAPVPARYSDGQSPRVHPVWLEIDGDMLSLRGDGIERRIPLAGLRWPERQRHGSRLLELDDGATLSSDDAAAWDALAARAGHHDSLAVRLQQSWSRVVLALVLVCAVFGSAYVWGIPLAGQVVTALVPLEVDRRLGEAALQQLDQRGMKPSRLPTLEQERLRDLANRAIARAQRHDDAPTIPIDIMFRDAGGMANALALPGGRIVVTDALVELAAGRDDIVVGVLGHEAGHVQHRHSMRMIVQASLVGAGAALLFGDIGSWLAAAPAMLGELAYSRDLEREADAASLAVLQANAISGQAMVDFFELMARPGTGTGHPDEAESDAASQPPRRDGGPPASDRPRTGLAALLSTHPVDAERIAYFRSHR